MELNLLKLPDSPDTIHVIPGLSGPGSQDYNNLNVIYRQLVSLLEENDILFLGGDFVNMCMNCCINDASQKEVNPNMPNKICGSKDTTIDESCNCSNKINQTNRFPGQATMPLSCCVDSKYRKGPYKGDQDELIDLALAAMNRGAKIIMLDDLMFMTKIYASSKPANDYMNMRLSSNSNFYHYVIPGMPLDRSGDAPHTHSKICAGIYMNNDNPGLRGIWGSFNPSYNMSLTHEIGVTISGLLTNKFISVLTQYLVNIAYFFIRTPPAIVENGQASIPNISSSGGVDLGKSFDLSQLSSKGKFVYNGNWISSKSGDGFGQSTVGPNPTTPGDNAINFVELTEPLTTILQKLAIADPSLPNVKDVVPKMVNVFANSINNKEPIVVPLVKCCGKVLPTQCADKNNYSSNTPKSPLDNFNPLREKWPHNRIYFEDKNVSFSLGVDSMQFNGVQPGRTFLLQNWNCGLDTVKSIFQEAEKWVKVGIYSSMIECDLKNKQQSPNTKCKDNDCCSGTDEINWMLGNSIGSLISKKIPLFLIQPKPKTEKNASIFNITGSDQIYARWWNHGGLHWKYYMNEKSILFSTQHPTNFFYNCGTSSALGTLGYDLKISNSPNLVNYFSNIFQYQWSGAGYIKNVEGVKDNSGKSRGGPDNLPCPDGSSGCCKVISKPCGPCFDGDIGNNIPSTPHVSKNDINNIIMSSVLVITTIIALIFRNKPKYLGISASACLIIIGVFVYLN